MTDLSLASEFPAATREAWLALVEAVLKGADFERRLVSRSADGIAVGPLYEKAEAVSQPWRGKAGAWAVAQAVDHPDPAEANALALLDLEGGADALVLAFAGAPGARGFGLAVADLDDLDRALAGVMLDLVGLRLDAGAAGRQAAALLLALARRRGHDFATLDLDLALDPIGAAASAGRFSAPWDVVARRCAETARALDEMGVGGRAFLADARPYHEAGASEAQELAALLATGVAYLRALEGGGLDLDAARRRIAFLAVADADEFMTVAKLRALRRLWARVEEACGVSPAPAIVHAETAWRGTARRDPYVNMLRATIAAFSAGIGGADTIRVLPFTAALGLPDAFARRVARNTQSVLLDEANLWRVADPAAGAGGFEALTEALCSAAWAAFQEIERAGGMAASLLDGSFQAHVATARHARSHAVATRRAPITGVSEFPHLAEAPVAVLAPAPAEEPGAEPPAPRTESSGAAVADFAALVERAQSGAPFASLSPGLGEPVAFARLPSARDAAPFERLRDLADRVLAQTGTRPRIFLANLGPVAAFTARATFVRNLFEAGGIEAVGNDGFATAAEAASAFAASGAPIACIASSDALYGEMAKDAACALKGAGCIRLWLAGRPGDREEEWRAAGIDGFVHVGMDALSLLAEAHAALQIGGEIG